jgi:uncharacterized membrane protein (UPF0127 family)
MRRFFPRFLLALAVMTIAATGQSAIAASAAAPEGQPMLLPVDPDVLTVETAAGERRFRIEIADDDGERARGLMFRTVMPDDRGMLFVFRSTRLLTFWMKDTPMPLDLLFIDEDGVVRAVMPGIPYSEAPISPPVPVRFVLELKSGTAQKAGIAEGDRIHHPQIDAAGE